MRAKGNGNETCCEQERFPWCGIRLTALWESYELNISLQICCLLWKWYLCICTYRCPDSTRPETMRPCLLPCKKDCIVTPFSEWTRCPTACQPGKPIKREQNFGQLVTSMAMGKGWRGTRSPPRAFRTSFVHAMCLHLSQYCWDFGNSALSPSKGS